MDWQQWFARWEAMQNCYVPYRLHRFDLMLRLPDLPVDSRLSILDLGCGLGSVAFHALGRYPHARVVAVDWNPVLLDMGRRMAEAKGEERIRFVQADIRRPDWWAAYEEAFDLVLSANALHWLNADHLAETYRRVYRALKPGGWFMISDHIASDYPETQARYRQMLQAQQRAALSTTNADDWDGFWEALSREMGQSDLLAQHNQAEIWEGSEDGQPRQFHLDALRACGFQQIEFHWQEMGEAIIGARK
jgi:ubiquinone/menaquinone biosynthesis C-methylase UbiE